jgi:hypothetical protein
MTWGLCLYCPSARNNFHFQRVVQTPWQTVSVACSAGLVIWHGWPLGQITFGCVRVQGEAVLGIIGCSVAPLTPTYQMPGAPLTCDSPVSPDIARSPGGQSCS